ncbi:MAG: 2-oxoglutarate dehydrogenase E1 component [Chitinivibrionales bacterium]|nr:2-oxoglutarate dehydrogenase E1 component [Chitinivibrionales bacterium]
MSNDTYIENLYRQWADNPRSVNEEWNRFFTDSQQKNGSASVGEITAGLSVNSFDYKQARVNSLLWAFRDVGYIYAKINPLGGDYSIDHNYLPHEIPGLYEKLDPAAFDLSKEDMNGIFSAGRAMQPDKAPLREIIPAFQQTYCSSIGVEFLHIQNKQIRRWLIDKMESTRNRIRLTAGQRRKILRDLIRTEELEHSLHTFFIGQKRFSLEGAEGVIPALHFLVDSAQKFRITDIVMGTTHRGRLSILTTILKMSPEELFAKFEENFQPGMYGGAGDVKYHIGFDINHMHTDGTTVHVSINANPSHLESVDPVVQGKARGLQKKKGDTNRTHVVPVLLHGDAAFSGQGIVAETLNLSRLEGYRTGGTIHIIINNQIGFTTPSRSARSSIFPTDVAKMLPVPIFHVNGDDPEALVHVVELALQYRQHFAQDVVIDIFTFRRHGHNEGDEPSFTHPRMYKLIDSHPGVTVKYAEKLVQEKIVSEHEISDTRKEYGSMFKAALERTRTNNFKPTNTTQGPSWDVLERRYSHKPIVTGVNKEKLLEIADHLTALPDKFNVHPKLARIIAGKAEMLKKKGVVDWAFAESLAFGSLLTEGVDIRLSGQDCCRGTFSQRHLTWWDHESPIPQHYTPLRHLGAGQAGFSVYDSPLSEYSVLGFEYGYSLINPHALTIWEAQFGDFCNGAQVIIDNYLVSAESKWDRLSGLVLLLPHGYEGQGPDHSSAHLARFLQLCAGDNIQVVNATTPAQYFHLLRRQMKRSFRKPLIIMAPKSLLRHPQAVSPFEDLTQGAFSEVLDDPENPAHSRKLVFCSGKVYYDIMQARTERNDKRLAVIRLEQLYPIKVEEVKNILEKYPSVQQVCWFQEEHRNYGAWSYLCEQFREAFPGLDLTYTGRREGSSSATGMYKKHLAEQREIMRRLFEEDDA